MKKDIDMTLIPASVSRPVLAGLIAFHILIIIASNYLVQLPITLFGWHINAAIK